MGIIKMLCGPKPNPSGFEASSLIDLLDEIILEDKQAKIKTRCERSGCLTADVVDGKCKYCEREDDPCTHPKGLWCTTCRPS